MLKFQSVLPCNDYDTLTKVWQCSGFKVCAEETRMQGINICVILVVKNACIEVFIETKEVI